MERENRQSALKQLLEIAAANGYVTFDDILKCADDHSLSIGDVDWLSSMVGARNVIIYDNAPATVQANEDDDFDDYAQVDYEHTFSEAIELCPELSPTIEAIRRIMPPQWGEVKRLKYQVKEGNQHARQRLIEMYLRLSVRIAVSRAKAYDLDLADTVGDAFVGLLLAVDKYDPDKSGPFVSFASMWIYQNIAREQSTCNPNVYFPVHRKEWYFTMYPIMKARGCIECDELPYCNKAIEMICDKISCDSDQAKDVIMAVQSCLDISEYESTDHPSVVISEDDAIGTVETSIRREMLLEILDTLTERQRNVIMERYGFNNQKEKTLEDLGQIYHLTRERIRQIEATAMRKLRTNRQIRALHDN